MNTAPVDQNIHPEIAALLAAGERERALIRVLYKSRPHAVRATILMEMLGIKFRDRHGFIDPPTAYFEFASIVARVRRLLSGSGRLELRCTGGKCTDELWISEHSGSPG